MRQDAVPADVEQHALRAVGGDIAEPVVEVFVVLLAQIAEGIEEIAGKQADADAQLQDEEFVFQRPLFLGIEQAGEENLGGVAGQRAVVVDDKGHRRGVGEKRLVAALAQVFLAQLPFQRLGQRHEVLDDGRLDWALARIASAADMNYARRWHSAVRCLSWCTDMAISFQGLALSASLLGAPWAKVRVPKWWMYKSLQHASVNPACLALLLKMSVSKIDRSVHWLRLPTRLSTSRLISRQKPPRRSTSTHLPLCSSRHLRQSCLDGG